MSTTTDSRVALVTGGSRGIGAATAKRLAADGLRVALTYSSSKDAAEQVAKEIEQAGGEAIAIEADAADEAATRAAVDATVEAFGRLDVVVANAGIVRAKPLGDIEVSTFDQVMDVNVRGVFVLAHAAFPHLGEGSRFLVTGSINADVSYMPGMTSYSTSKAAVQGMVRGLAHELAAKGGTANVVQPGPVDTDMNPADGEMAQMLTPMTALGRYGRAEEIADTFAFLASPQASYITGASLDVDGGLTV